MWKLLVVTLFALGKSSLIDRFENWAHEFSIKFNDRQHFNDIFNTWKENNKFIEEINALNLTYTLGHNSFSGMNSEQYREYMGFSKPLLSNNEYVSAEPVDLNTLPKSVDWEEKGAVTPIKDQGQCGSCWSFSATGALEGAYYTKYGILESFSEQQLVDCDTRKSGGKDMGCKGGLMDNAFEWIKKNGGLCNEMYYPYVSGTTKTGNTCQKSCEVVIKSGVRDYTDVAPSSEDAMKSALVKQPVSIAIEADQKEFQLYKSGVFTGKCGVNLDHGVLLVGYGELDGVAYWKVKNSWSTKWGLKGYILLGRGSEYNNGDGQCGLLLQASYPNL